MFGYKQKTDYFETSQYIARNEAMAASDGNNGDIDLLQHCFRHGILYASLQCEPSVALLMNKALRYIYSRRADGDMRVGRQSVDK